MIVVVLLLAMIIGGAGAVTETTTTAASAFVCSHSFARNHKKERAPVLAAVESSQIQNSKYPQVKRIFASSSLSSLSSSLSSSSRTILAMTRKSSSSKESFSQPLSQDSSSWSLDPLYASLLLLFVGFAVAGPGEFNDPSDINLINLFIANPTDPGGDWTPGYLLVFNYFGVMPIVLLCLVLPQASKQGLPALPFLLASFGLGYFSVGPYLTFRAPPRDVFVPSEAGWLTNNVLENKLLSWGLVAATVAMPFAVGVVDAILDHRLGVLVDDYTALFASSKLVSASSLDAIILNVVVASLIPRDVTLRQPDVPLEMAQRIGAATLLLPFVGPALYIALRPPLPTSIQEEYFVE